MAKKEHELEKITTLKGFVRGITEDGQSVLVSIRDIAEITRMWMSTANKDAKGLLNNTFFNYFGGFRLTQASQAEDLNLLHTQVTNGLHAFTVTNTVPGLPESFGTVIHSQRSAINNVSTSQVIAQFFFSFTKKFFFRIGSGNGTEVIFNDWKEL